MSLTLVTAEPESERGLTDLVDPFVVLNDRGGFSRVLLAQVLGPDGSPTADVALKLQGDEYPLSPAGAEAPYDNDQVDAGWEREVRILERCRDAAVGIPTPLEVLAREPGRPAVIAPTFFCKERRAFFVATCPECGEALRTVRDDALLERRGLPRHDRTLSRFLGCLTCLGPDAGRVWTLVMDQEYPARWVGDQTALFRAMRSLATASAAGARIPCQGCDRVPTCYPEDGAAGDAVRFLSPVTFYDSQAIAFAVFHLRYDEIAALIGGAPLGEIVARIGELGRRRLVEQRGERLLREPYFFAHDPEGKLPIEVLRLKLDLFRRVCAAVAALHRQSREPHLALSPQSVMVRLPNASSGLPALWGTSVGVFGLGNARPRGMREGHQTESRATGYLPPRHVDPTYAAEELRMRPLRDAVCTIVLQAPKAVGSDLFEISAQVECDALDSSSLSAKDVVHLTLVQGRPPLTLSIVGSLEGGGAPPTVRSEPMKLPADVRAAITQLAGQRLTRGRVTVHPCLHVAADVHALGMMLLVGLLANAERSPAEVAPVVHRAAQRIGMLASESGAPDPIALTSAATALVMDDFRQEFAPRFLVHDPARALAVERAVPPGLWAEAIVLGLRAVTNIPGFSICRSRSDFDPQHPEVKAEYLLQLTRSLVRRVDVPLFGLPGRQSSIRGAIRTVARELHRDSGVD